MLVSWMVATCGFVKGAAVGVVAALAAKRMVTNELRRR
jgi:uncharacterized membrane-anchored protein YhcB (DUF1043 family)